MTMTTWRLSALCLGILARLVRAVDATTIQSPKGVIDLGYAKHVPTYVDMTESGRKVSVYKNIRFANPPNGNLRFRLPDTRLPKVGGIQDGSVADLQTHCISSAPASVPFPPYNGTTWGREDCLFLDVYVPENVNPGDDVPVLHYFVGGGFAFGSKDMFSSPMGLFDAMANDTKFIFVANNYRLGLPGWTYMPGQDMTANLGMHDCLAAAEWTSKYIRRFGGDPGRITVVGQSAGAGIIALLTVLNGGKGKLPFQQGWLSSPAVPPRRKPLARQQRLFTMILDKANCTSVECLRSLPEESMRHLNDFFINETPSDAGGGLFGPAPGFGPVPDGTFIPDMAAALLQLGAFHKQLRSLVLGNAANEGMGTSHDTGLPEYFPTMVRQILSTAGNQTIADIQSQYDFAGNPAKLAWDWTTDVIFACNAANIATAYKNRARRYIFSVPPAVHGQDLYYMFYVNQTSTPVDSVESARAYQKNMLNFLHGREMQWPYYGSDKRITNITADGFEDVSLPADLEDRCAMINQVLLDPANGA